MSRAIARVWIPSALVALSLGCGSASGTVESNETTSLGTTAEALAPGQLSLLTHLENIGDRWTAEGVYNGTKGQSLRLEGFELSTTVPNLGIQYFAHLQGIGDTGWYDAPGFVGTRGQSRRLEGFAIRLLGSLAAVNDVWYMCHVQDVGDMGPMKNGAFCGYRGMSRRVEGMAVWIHPVQTCSWLPSQNATGCSSSYVESATPRCVDSEPTPVNEQLRALVAQGCSTPIWWTASDPSTHQKRMKKITMCPTSLTSTVNQIGTLELATRAAHVNTTFCDAQIPAPYPGYMWAVVWDDPTCGPGGCMSQMQMPDW